ncbi:MAG: hypothetical protein A2068_13340 [Ignavibacteria bacterium GWB2_35_6b]|nr:MAG: hypothetical protein A2068_13340 [Ignavibacteria bacterium GWB2_35_6b]
MEDFNDIKIEGGNLGAEEQQQNKQSFQPPSFFQIAFMKMTKDMRFIGMYHIIIGALSCLTIVGAVIGVPVIFIGLKMREAADQFDIFKLANNPQALRKGFELQGKFFNIWKIIVIISLVLAALYLIAMIFFFGYLFTSLNSYGS